MPAPEGPRPRKATLAFLLLLLLSPSAGRGEEGMWTFDHPPLDALREKYGFTATGEWLEHVRLSSVRFNDGGSGSFVSPDGLVLTNHHVASGQLAKLSSKQKDYRSEGFHARTRSGELPCPDLELNVLVSMEDVTRRIRDAVPTGMPEAEALKARRAAMAGIERESLAATGLRSDVVTLYHGGEYWLYRYRKYTDVRIVFAPEARIAYYGGDYDNFTFPRHDLDMALFRVYENGQPLHPKHYLKWNARGPEADELVFVSGHPGTTHRLFTVAQLETERDTVQPLAIAALKRRLEDARAYARRGREEARQIAATLQSLENGIKARSGYLRGLSDPALFEGKRKEEKELKDRSGARPGGTAPYASAWSRIAAAEKRRRRIYRTFWFQQLRGSRFTEQMVNLVRYPTEVAKPDGDRLKEFNESRLESLRYRLLSPAPVYPPMEAALLAGALRESAEALGPQDPFVQAALGGRDPAAVAGELMAGTRLIDPAARRALLEGGAAAVAASTDPLVRFVLSLDPRMRRNRQEMEDRVESVLDAAGEQIGQARFAVYGKRAYPDATFTLRLSYGSVRGYPMNGTEAPPFTTLHGLFDRALAFGMKEPWDLPPRYRERKGALDLATRLNFVSATDVIGGNSGSPVINRNGELVGLVFDGNIESLAGDYAYDGEVNRTIAVHPAAMTHLLRKLYDAGELADELEGRPPAKRKP